VQTKRLAESFELLTGSVALTRLEKFPCKATCDPAVFLWNAWINLGAKVCIVPHHTVPAFTTPLLPPCCSTGELRLQSPGVMESGMGKCQTTNPGFSYPSR